MTDDELEEALREMERRFAAQTEPETVFDRVDEPLAEYLKRIVREMLAAIRYPEVVNLPEPDRTKRLFEAVREEHDIEEDRDEAVIEALRNHPGADHRMDVRSRFACLTAAVAARNDLETSDGETLEALVEAGRTDEADRLLVGETYDWLAETGGGSRPEASP